MRPQPKRQNDAPTQGRGAQIIDLATRRVIPVFTQRKSGDRVGFFAIALCIVGLGAVALWLFLSRPAPIVPLEPPPAIATGASPADPASVSPETEDAAPEEGAEASDPFAELPEQAILAPPAPAPVLAMPPELEDLSTPTSEAPANANPNDTPTLVFDSGGSAPAAAAGRSAPVPVAKETPASNSADPSATITKGTRIPAVLETTIDSSAPGFVRAIISTDVRSFDGKRVLVPRSSRLIGQYRSAKEGGQRRAYVVWTQLVRADGKSMKLAPSATPGSESERQFLARFGSATLMSAVGTSRSSTSKDSAIRIRQGEPIRVFAAKNLDFASGS